MSSAVVSTDHERVLFGQLLSPALRALLQPDAPHAHYTPYVVLWLLIFQRLHANASLARAVDEFLAHRAADGALEHAPSANTGAYSHARNRLDTAVARAVADHVAQQLLTDAATARDHRPTVLLDGTTVQLPHTPELCRAFPPASNPHGTSHWPIRHLLVAHDLDTGLARRPEFGPMYGPDALSELALALRLLPRLPADALVLADRNFGVFALAHAVAHSGRDVLVHLTAPRFRALRRKARSHAPGVWAVTWVPSAWDRQQHPDLPADARVCGWLHEVRVRDALTLWLFTTVADTSAELAARYRQRAEVETDIRDLKHTLALDRLTAKSAGMVEKELVVGVLAFNLVNQVRRLAAREAGVAPRRLSFAGVWSVVRAWLGAWVAGASHDACQRRFEHLLRGAAQRQLPRRTAMRNYPRATIPRASPYPKHKPKTAVQPSD
jgi:Transposase DDE domain